MTAASILGRAADLIENQSADPRRAWRKTARPEQLMPPDPWRIWLLMGGRGSGKTRAGAQALADMILSDPEPGEWAIVAPTYRDAWSTCIEGESGILVACGSSIAKVKAGDCPVIQSAARGYAEIRFRNGQLLRADSADDGALRIQGKNLKAVWCVTYDAPVLTAAGWVPIQDITPGTLAATRSGWRRVTAAVMTASKAAVLTITTRNGREVSCTPEHRIHTSRGWVEAQDLCIGDTLTAWSHFKYLSQGHHHGMTGTASAGTGRTRGTTSTKDMAGCTQLSGVQLPDARSRQGMSSTTSATTRLITGQRTWSHSPGQSTTGGIAVRPETQTHAPGSAPVPWNPGHDESHERSRASSAARNSSPEALGRQSITVLEEVSATTLDVVTHVRPSGSAAVYDLTVEDAHEFFAGGILVKNCDEIGLFHNWETAWDESIAYAVRKGASKIIATGTPKVSRPAARLLRRLIKESKDDPTVIVQRLLTKDNLGNLSETFFRSVIAHSSGTKLERQELEGELLDDNEDALWSRDTIEKNRIAPDKVPDLVRIVVALDPAVTSLTSSDETGIIVAGQDARGHGYVLADYSMRASPQKCMQKAVHAYTTWNADRVIGEANNGGDFIGDLLRAVDPDIPYSKVVASRGKAVRAEPSSALYEQCVAAGTMITTARGYVPVEQVVVGDSVLTRAGYKKVTWSGCSGIRPTVVITTDTGQELTCTAEHPVYVPGRGFVNGGLLDPRRDRILLWREYARTVASVPVAVEPGASHAPHDSVGRQAHVTTRSSASMWSTRASGTTIKTATGVPRAAVISGSCTGWSGKTTLGRYQTAGTSTIETGTLATGTSIISQPALCRSISQAFMATTAISTFRTSWTVSGKRSTSGGATGSLLSSPAMSVITSTSHVEPNPGSALMSATSPGGIVSVLPGSQVPVYDIQVAGQPEFYANGILVHNCRVHHAGVFTELEDEMVSWVPGDGSSPDRLDALVWALTSLKGLSRGSWAEAFGAVTCRGCERVYMGESKAACPHCGRAKDAEDAWAQAEIS